MFFERPIPGTGRGTRSREGCVVPTKDEYFQGALWRRACFSLGHHAYSLQTLERMQKKEGWGKVLLGRGQRCCPCAPAEGGRQRRCSILAAHLCSSRVFPTCRLLHRPQKQQLRNDATYQAVCLVKTLLGLPVGVLLCSLCRPAFISCFAFSVPKAKTGPFGYRVISCPR